MRPVISIALALSFFSLAAQDNQVLIETRVAEVNRSVVKELGFQFGFGPSFSFLSNTDKENRQAAVGMSVQGGVSVVFSDVIALETGMFFTQYGSKNTSPFNDITFKQLINALGAEATAVISAPRLITPSVRPSVVVGLRVGGNTGGVNVIKYDGDKQKERFDLQEQDNKAVVLLKTGVTTTIRTNAGDFSTGVFILGGLTETNKNAPDRTVPILFEIPFIYRFFGKREKTQNREELLIFIKPKIVD